MVEICSCELIEHVDCIYSEHVIKQPVAHLQCNIICCVRCFVVISITPMTWSHMI